MGWLSGEYAALLKKRALSMLSLAKSLLREGQNDLAALNAEYAAQLYLKALLYRVTGEEWGARNKVPPGSAVSGSRGRWIQAGG